MFRVGIAPNTARASWFGNWQVIGRISEEPKRFGKRNAKRLAALGGKRLDDFPRPAKPRDTAVSWQRTASDVTEVE